MQTKNLLETPRVAETRGGLLQAYLGRRSIRSVQRTSKNRNFYGRPLKL